MWPGLWFRLRIPREQGLAGMVSEIPQVILGVNTGLNFCILWRGPWGTLAGSFGGVQNPSASPRTGSFVKKTNLTSPIVLVVRPYSGLVTS